jgi:dTMP kinase
VFICFEGIDGAGKSTQARMLVQRLSAEGYSAELVADPGTTQIGTAIRQILLHNDSPISTVAQMLLFSAARAELSTYIEKLIAANTVVVCDRWLLSTLVYQGVINGVSEQLILDIFSATDCSRPDICFLLDLSPAEAKERMGPPRDRYERRSLTDRQRMRQAYLAFAEQGHAAATYTIDAEQAADMTHTQVYAIVHRVVQERGFIQKRMESKNVGRIRAASAPVGAGADLLHDAAGSPATRAGVAHAPEK